MTNINLFEFENRLYKQGFELVAGVDEAGRGPLAGPIVAAAVILPQKITIKGLKECKQLTPNKREQLYREIIAKCFSYSIELFDNNYIDEFGLHKANLGILKKAVLKLDTKPDFVLVDGYKLNELGISNLRIIKGDMVSASIAAASIMAKVYRDRIMIKNHKKYPRYGFDSHKGYSCRRHFEALQKHGPSPLHRRSFSPIKKFYK